MAQKELEASMGEAMTLQLEDFGSIGILRALRIVSKYRHGSATYTRAFAPPASLLETPRAQSRDMLMMERPRSAFS